MNPQTGVIVQKFPTTEHRQWCGEWSDDDSHLVAGAHRSIVDAAQHR